MMRVLVYLSGAILFSQTAFGQSAEPAATFEAASIQASPQGGTMFVFLQGPFLRSGRYEIRFASMVDLVRTAYNVDAEKVVGGPSWLEMDRFHVVAKAPANATAETTRSMLQALLADRFKLVAHPDSRPMPAYSLTAGKKTSLKKSDGSGDSGCKFVPPAPPPPGTQTLPLLQYNCRNITMAAFAETFRNIPLAQQYFSNIPVVDKTGLEGAWDFDIKYSVRGPAALGELITLPDALEKLGLKVEPAKVPMSVIVVDSVNQKATADPPGVADALHLAAAPTEFEVADIKPTSPDFKGIRLQIQPGGRVNISGVSLQFLLQQMWNVTNDMIVGAPKWLDADRYDIIAKAPSAALSTQVGQGGQRGPTVDLETVFAMLRNLLKERFKLDVHTEERPVQAYTLTAVKPKMKKADPAGRTRFVNGPAPDAKDPRNANPALSRLVTVQNMTMAQFAAQLQRMAPGYIQSPVLDATGLEGSFDFTLNFSPAGMMQAMAGAGRGGRGGGDAVPAAGSVAEASDPSGVVTLPEAIERQLGLKLELQKRPVSVLVIDHVERTPTEN